MSKNPKIFGKELRLSWQELTIGLAAIVLGLVLLILPGVAASVVLCGIGAIGIIIGIVHVVRYFTLDAKAAIFGFDLSIGLVGGILVIILKDFLISLLPVFFGLVVLLGGIAKVQTTLSLKRMNAPHWYMELVAAVISIALGTVILCNPFSTALLLMRIIGAALLVEGIQDLISIYTFKKARDAFFVEFEEDK